MHFPIAHRVFLLALLCIALTTAAGLALVRWALFAPEIGTVATEIERERIDALAAALSAGDSGRGGWAFVHLDPPARARVLRATLARVAPDAAGALAYRVGVLDADGRRMAGAAPHPLTVALASIDSVRRPIVVDGRRVGEVLVLRPSPGDDGIATAFLVAHQRDLLLLAIVGLLLAATMAAALALALRGPVRRLVEAAHALENGRFDAPLDVARRDEFGVLARAYDRLSHRLEDAQRMRRRWIAETAHELRTPLAVLRGQLDGFEDGVRAPSPDNIALMSRQVHALTRIVEDLHTLAVADTGRLSLDVAEVDVGELMGEVFADFETKFRSAGLTPRFVPATRAVARCDRARLRQVLANLLENCVRYTDAGGRIDVAVDVEGDEVRVVVDDSAPGVSAEMRTRLGERDLPVNDDARAGHGGAGLGLALSRALLEAQGGRLDFEASPLGGLRAIVALQTAEDA